MELKEVMFNQAYPKRDGESVVSGRGVFNIGTFKLNFGFGCWRCE